MTIQVPETEEEVVANRAKAQIAKLSRRRSRSLVCALFFSILVPALISVGLWGFSITSLFIALIFYSNYFSANGHLHLVKNRAKNRRKLAPDFSKLKPESATELGTISIPSGGVLSRTR